MKKFAICIVLLFVLLAGCACAEIRYVDNGSAWNERLNLRAQPSRSAQSLGRYYTGVRVQVKEDLGDWCRVVIAQGVDGREVEGYMMSAYLRPVDGWSGACYLPSIVHNGKPAYVMGYRGSQLHVCYADGQMTFIDGSGITLEKPAEGERLLKERICTASGGASLYANNRMVARLYGGVFLDDSLLLPGNRTALAGLQDENDEVRGFLYGGFTWTDNGANCQEQYAVYESDSGLIEVLGEMADGRTILRLTQSVADGSQIVLTDGFHLAGLKPLARVGAYYRYTRPLLDEEADYETVARVYSHLDADVSRYISGCTAQVERLIDFQYGHRVVQVKFVDVYGAVRGIAELLEDMVLWQWEDNG